LTLLPSTGSILGAFEGLAFEEADTQLSTDEVLFLYTDGLTEARRDGVFYGEERLRDLLSTLRGRDSGEIVEGVLGAVLEFSDGALRDDLALLAIKRQHLPQDG
jgi:sigma-B regulation protein RsbU (phosphoserine phosphatase)